jgi:transposase
MDSILERAKTALSEDQHTKLKAVVEAFTYLSDRLEAKDMSVRELRELLFGKSTEKASTVLGNTKQATDSEPAKVDEKSDGSNGRANPKGHGRLGEEAYTGAARIRCKHATLRPGDPCPECKKGKVYIQQEPERLIRITGRAPLHATIYELERLRCALCGEIFKADPPTGIGDAKYDASAAAMIALLKYGNGLPFNRLEGLQGGFGIPLPASTQWEIVNEAAKKLAPIHEQLIREAAQGEVLHNDDTTAKILTLAAENSEDEKASARTGTFTTGIVSVSGDHKIALYFTGHQHAGENLTDVLKKRAKELGPPIQMCDGLSRNLPKEFEVVLSNCLAHGRRGFVKIIDEFPEECRHVIERLGEVYHHDAIAKHLGLKKEERLRYHQEHSGPIMKELKAWLDAQINEKLVEPNSNLGKAIHYMQKRWDALTLFLRVAGAPLDNNVCERALKKAILHRKNSLFFKTEHGAEVGDLYFSLIVTAQAHDVSPHDYLTTLLEHAAEAGQDPANWMPWNYRGTIARGAATSAASASAPS